MIRKRRETPVDVDGLEEVEHAIEHLGGVVGTGCAAFSGTFANLESR